MSAGGQSVSSVSGARRFTVRELQGLFLEPAQAHRSSEYDALRIYLSRDLELLEIAAHAQITMIMPNFLVSVSLYLHLLTPTPNTEDALRQIFAGLCNDDIYHHFRTHCLHNRERLIELLTTKRVQTNSLHRCAVLLPAFCLVNRRFPDRQWTVVDLGTSAGMNLIWDAYSYSYPELGGRVVSSRFESEVDLEIDFSWRGPKPKSPIDFFRLPQVNKRIGVDLEPLDLAIPAHRQWYACFTNYLPVLVEGFLRLRQKVDFQLLAGDAIAKLGPLAAATPKDELLVIMHSFFAGQLPKEARAALDGELAKIGSARDLAIVSIEDEPENHRPVELWLRTYRNGKLSEERLARCEQALDVGHWLEWLGPID